MGGRQKIFFAVSAVISIIGLQVLEQCNLESLNTFSMRITLAMIWWLANVFDIITTYLIMRWFGKEWELNTLAVWFTEKFGVLLGLLIFKLIVLWIVYFIDFTSSRRSFIILFSSICWVAALWNTYLLIRYRHMKNCDI